jgi:prolipoprotein diacylglyceryltransferase
LVIYAVSLLIYKKQGNKPGFVFGCFISMLFTVRFFLEYFKTEQAMYDTGVALTTGQLLSIPFVLVGIGCILWSLKNRQPNLMP